MKSKIRNIMTKGAGLLLAAGLLASCSDDFSQPPVNVPEGGIGSGAWNDPMTAYQVQIGSVNDGLEEIWATGYIVGAINTDVTNSLNNRSAVFEPGVSGKYDTNLLISDYTPEQLEEMFVTPDGDTRIDHVASLQLPSGQVRDALNIQTNSDSFGRQVTVKGTVGEKYCGVYGVKSVSEFNWGAVGIEPPVFPPIEGAFFENFEASTNFTPYKEQGWKNVMVAGGLSGWYIKSFGGTNFATVSAYLGSATGGPYENWLLTPEIDLELLDSKTLRFDSQAGYAAADQIFEVYVLVGDNPASKLTERTKLEATLASNPPASAYTGWIDSGLIDLSQFSGKIRIGWRYRSPHGGSGNSTTFNVDNINVGQARTN